MAKLRALHGVRYRPQRIPGGLGAVVAPPYDVVSEEEVRALLARSPYNLIRLDLGAGATGAAQGDYEASARTFLLWLEQGLLERDPEPSLYVYRKLYRRPEAAGAGRAAAGGDLAALTVVLGAMRLEPFEAGSILPHEHTHPGVKQDRLRLLQACEANFSPIFAFYEDAEGQVRAVVEEAVKQLPVAEFAGEWPGEAEQLWRITDPERLRAVAGWIDRTPVFIADGHHRYETALAYREQRLAAGGSSAVELAGWNHVLMGLAAIEWGGLTICPIHRVIRAPGMGGSARLVQALEAAFQVVDQGPMASAADALERVRSAGERHGPAFAVYTSPGIWRLCVQRGDAVPPDPVSGLDVSVLHRLWLDSLRQAGLVTEVRYTHDAAQAVAAVDRGEAEACALMRPATLQQVQAVARAGLKMPQKSTYFYPKLTSGLVMADLRVPVVPLV